MIAIDLSTHQALDVDPESNTTILFAIEEAKGAILDFSQRTVRVSWFCFMSIQYKRKMTQYNTLNGKLSNSPLDKLKSGIKNSTQVTLEVSSSVFGDSNDETNFPQALLSTKFWSLVKPGNWPKIKDGVHVINIDEHKSIGTH